MKDKINLYTFYTETHNTLYEEYFLKSFYEKKLDENFNLKVRKFAQKSNDGSFNSKGFKETMFDKLSLIKDAIQENPENPFVYSDCDVVFYKNFYDDIFLDSNIDALFQNDQNTLCAGFFIAKSTYKFKNFIDVVCHNNYKYPNDQVTMNAFKDNINYKLLECDKYFTIGNLLGLYSGESFSLGEKVKSEIILHHANFTIGIENKIKLINEVKNQVCME